MVAKILANDMLQFYLNEELNLVRKQNYLLDHSDAMPDSTPRWTDKKNALISVLYCFDEMSSIENGNIPLSRLAAHFEYAFDIKLGIITRAFNEMKLKSNPTEYIDAMKQALLRRINETENRYISRKLNTNK